MSREVIPQRYGYALVEENAQAVERVLRRLNAARGVLQDGFGLRARDAGEPGKKLIQRRAAFEVLEQGADGHARAAKYPRPADLGGVLFHGRAGGPIEHGQILLPCDPAKFVPITIYATLPNAIAARWGNRGLSLRFLRL